MTHRDRSALAACLPVAPATQDSAASVTFLFPFSLPSCHFINSVTFLLQAGRTFRLGGFHRSGSVYEPSYYSISFGSIFTYFITFQNHLITWS